MWNATFKDLLGVVSQESVEDVGGEVEALLRKLVGKEKDSVVLER